MFDTEKETCLVANESVVSEDPSLWICTKIMGFKRPNRMAAKEGKNHAELNPVLANK